MNVLALNFSHKGLNSISYLYFCYMKKMIERKYESVVTELMASKEINKILRDDAYVSEIIDKIKKADIIFFVAPVYAYCLPAQVPVFLDRLLAVGGNGVFADKFVAGLLTSAKIHDNIAIDDLHSLCKSIKANVCGVISLDMDLKANKDLNATLDKYLDNVFSRAFVDKEVQSVKIDNRVVVLTDSSGFDFEVRILKYLKNPPEVIYLNEKKISFCIGDLSCMFGECIYSGDDFNILFNKLESAKIVIIAYSDDRISAAMRNFFSRALSIGQHHESLPGKHIVVINKNNIPLINEWAFAYAQMQSCNLEGVITYDTTDDELYGILKSADRNSKNAFIYPETGVKLGAFKSFNEIVLMNGFVMPKDIDFLRKNKHRSILVKVYSLLNLIYKIKSVRRFFKMNVARLMIMPHKKWLSKTNSFNS